MITHVVSSIPDSLVKPALIARMCLNNACMTIVVADMHHIHFVLHFLLLLTT